MAVDRVEELGGDEAGEDRGGGAAQPERDDERPARVDEARGVEHDVVRLRVEQVEEDVGDDRRVAALRVPDELELPGRPARREQQDGVVRLHVDRHRRGGRGGGVREQIVEREQLRVEAGVAVRDRELGTGGGEDRLLLGRGEPRIERHARDPGLDAREVERDGVEAVADEQADPVDAAREQDVRDPVRELVHLGEGERRVAAEDGGPGAVAACPAADQLRCRHGYNALTKTYGGDLVSTWSIHPVELQAEVAGWPR